MCTADGGPEVASSKSSKSSSGVFMRRRVPHFGGGSYRISAGEGGISRARNRDGWFECGGLNFCGPHASPMLTERSCGDVTKASERGMDMKTDEANPEVQPEAPSGVVRHLGLIKALAVIMAVLIVAALVVIVVTIYSRLAARDAARAATEIEITVPQGADVTAASSDKSGMTLVLDTPTGQQIWRLSPSGKLLQKVRIMPE